MEGEDRLPPHDDGAERGVIACCLIDPSACVPICIDKFSGKLDVFYDLRNRLLWQTIAEMWDEKEAIDDITLFNALRDLLRLDEVGGAVYLGALHDAAPSSAHLEHYIEIVVGKYVLRQAIAICTDGVTAAYEKQRSHDQLVDDLQHDVLELSNLVAGQDTLATAKELSTRGLDQLERIANLQGQPDGLPTGFPDLDYITGGLRNSEMIVIAARPAQGKSAIALNVMDYLTVELKIPVAFFSLEMASLQLMVRMLCSRARVNATSLRYHGATEIDTQKLVAARHAIAASPIYIDDASGLSILQLRARARRYHQQFGIRAIIIDYAQMLHSTRRCSNQQEEMSDVSNGIKGLAKELNIPVLALAQLNREVEKEKGRKPRMSDLRQTGSLEQDADIIGFLYRPQLPEGVSEGVAVQTNLLIGKNRNGPTGEIGLVFLKQFTRFESAAKEEPQQTTQHSPDP